jgi:hypothetical protein
MISPFLIFLWSILFGSQVLEAAFISVETCRPPLPYEWFINVTQTPPQFSVELMESAAGAAANLSLLINETLSTTGDIDSVSLVVGAPWGILTEHHVGNLKFNETSDDTAVNGSSIYRIASLSKVLRPYVSMLRVDMLGAYSPGNSYFASQRPTVFAGLNLQIPSQLGDFLRDYVGDAGQSDVWTRLRSLNQPNSRRSQY